MTTAEEWVRKNGWLPWKGGDYKTIKRIQADALREAAEIALTQGKYSQSPIEVATSKNIHDAILARAKEVEKV